MVNFNNDWEIVETFKTEIGKIEIFHHLKEDVYFIACNGLVKASDHIIHVTLKDAVEQVCSSLKTAHEEISKYLADK